MLDAEGDDRARDDGAPARWPRIGAADAAGAQRRLPGLVGDAPPMRRLTQLVERVAPLEAPVLVRGESGSGKELVARALHQWSRRAAGPYVTVNAATLGEDLGGSALFGHARGAFTGAHEARSGAFRRAHRGTLFIDELGSLPLRVQATLLRAVEEGVVQPLGEDRSHAVDVRLVAATCEPLEHMVARGAFRADLYQRLSVCVLAVPALRERLSDLPALVRYLVSASGMGDYRVADDAIDLLQHYSFPGNVRELRNVLTQAAICASSGSIGAAEVAEALAQRSTPLKPRLTPEEALSLLDEHGGNISAAARSAGVPRTSFRDLARRARETRSEGAERAYTLVLGRDDGREDETRTMLGRS
jgi:DNA-binding NtrC family response regulator